VKGVMAGSCESCLSEEQASAVLDAANFTSHSVFKINTVQINAGDLFGGNFKQNAKFNVVTDKGEFNSEQLISNFITEGQKYITPIKAASYYVIEKDCEDIIQNEISNNDKSYFAKALVFLIKGKEKEKSYVKVKVIFNQGKGPTKSLRIVKTQPSYLNTGALVNKVNEFLGYCGATIPVCIDVPASVDAASPNDIYIWIGKSRDKICNLVGLFAGLNCLNKPQLTTWCSRKSQEEKNIHPEKSSGHMDDAIWPSVIQPSGVIDESSFHYWKKIIAAKTDEEVAAFYILHVLGHNAGCSHTSPESSCEAGFMSSANYLEASREIDYSKLTFTGYIYWISPYLGEAYRWEHTKDYIEGRRYTANENSSLKKLDTEEIKKLIRGYIQN